MSNATQTSNAATQYREVTRNANAGERIKIVNSRDSRYRNGEVFVVDTSSSGGVYVKHPKGRNNGRMGIWHNEYVVIEPIVAPAPLTETAALNLPDLFAQFIRDNAPAVRSYLAEIDPDKCVEPTEDVSQPAPLTRAKVIEMARERVAELERIGGALHGRLAEGPFMTHYYNVEFHVNRDKRTVTALVRRRGNRNKPDAVGIAKAAPDDVFNADLGKAIAAERALGLTLTPEFVNAPKPAEVEPGMRVSFKTDAGNNREITVSRVTYDKIHGENAEMSGWVYKTAVERFGGLCTNPVITDDTDAVYTQATLYPCEAV